MKPYLLRKIVHIAGIFVYPFYLKLGMVIVYLLLIVTVVYIFSEVLRFHNVKVPLISHITLKLLKEGEKIAWHPITYSLGIIVGLIQPWYPPYYILIPLTIGDGITGLIGYLLKIRKKYWKRVITFFTVTCIALLLLKTPIVYSLVISLATSLTEAQVKLDDNIAITLTTFLVLQMLGASGVS